jgi:hypothetical protein
VGSSLNQRTAEFSLCNTLVLLLDLAFKLLARSLETQQGVSDILDYSRSFDTT